MLKVENLSVVVAGKEVLTNINLEIKDGQSMALLGPNGSGKTSLLMAIMGFSGYEVRKGDIIFRGKRINNLPVDERAKLGIGIMFQRPPTIRGVKLRQMVDVTKRGKFNTESAAEKLNLKHFLDRDINLGFSGGELKRSELLQLLAFSPKLGLFDEPESGVDLENIALVGKSINQIIKKNKNNASLIITHTGHIFDYVEPDQGCILVGGNLHCVGNPKKILKTVAKYGYEWCITCDGEKLKKKSYTPGR